jgi:hypothetical protein
MGSKKTTLKVDIKLVTTRNDSNNNCHDKIPIIVIQMLEFVFTVPEEDKHKLAQSNNSNQTVLLLKNRNSDSILTMQDS